MGFVKINNDVESEDDSSNFFPLSEKEDLLICKNPDKLRRLIKGLKEGTSIHYISDGDWSMNDLVIELLSTYKPAEVFITTYAIRELPMRQLILAQERKEITAVKMLLDYRAKARTPEVYQLAAMNLNSIFLTSIHAKVTILRSCKGCVSIIGSANWTSNPRIEAGVISLNAELADFHINWIQKVMDNAEVFE